MSYAYFAALLVLKLRVITGNNQGHRLLKIHTGKDQWSLLHEDTKSNGLDTLSLHPVRDGEYEVCALKTPNISYDNVVADVKQLPQAVKLSRNKLANAKINFKNYVKIEEIVRFVNSLPGRSNRYKNITVEVIGKSIEKRDLLMVKIEHPRAKRVMLLDAGIHAREWISVMLVLYVLTQVVEADSNSYASQVNWYIIPVMNPDGYVYSYTKDRLHRKNRNTKACQKGCHQCGVDLNRNFGYKFGVSGISKNPCSEVYCGTYAFSEPESQALADIMLRYKNKITVYLTFHSYGSYILYPWGYTEKPCDDWKDLRDAGIYAADAIKNYAPKSERLTVASSGADLYPAAGGSDDYAKSLGIKFSYTIELQEGGVTGFDPPAEFIETFVKETYIGVRAMIQYINNNKFRSSTGTAESNLTVSGKLLLTSALLVRYVLLQ